jgi:hypothetical protein
MDEPAFQTPYTPYPGGSTPSASVDPAEGKHELWRLLTLALVNTTIIAVAGIVTWWYVH